VLTERARAEACRRVGKDAHAVAAVARDLGVGWQTIMREVRDHGAPLVDDPQRLAGVAALGLDETSFLKATRVVPTRWVTGLVDLERGRLLDLVADRTRAGVDGWLGARSPAWLAQVATVALDPWRGYASALVASLGHATVVVDHFHAIRLANIVVDQARRRTQQATLGHRGRKHHWWLLRWAYRGGEPADQESEAGRARLPQLRHLPPAAAVALRRDVADAPHGTAARPLSGLCRVELRERHRSHRWHASNVSDPAGIAIGLDAGCQSAVLP
jgi:Transposase